MMTSRVHFDNQRVKLFAHIKNLYPWQRTQPVSRWWFQNANFNVSQWKREVQTISCLQITSKSCWDSWNKDRKLDNQSLRLLLLISIHKGKARIPQPKLNVVNPTVVHWSQCEGRCQKLTRKPSEFCYSGLLNSCAKMVTCGCANWDSLPTTNEVVRKWCFHRRVSVHVGGRYIMCTMG